MKKDMLALGGLVKRGIFIFLRDKAGVFFSLLAPLIVLVLYVLFLGDVQMSSIRSGLEGLPIEDKVLKAFVDSWMLAGVMAVSCITVSFSAQNLAIADKEDGVIADVLASPVKRSLISISYFLYNLAVTLVICFVVLAVSFVYLAISGWYLSVGEVFGIIGMLILSVISASLFSTLICTFIKSVSAHGAFVGIMSAAIGFLIGAYMPLSIFPKAVQYVVLFLPGTYSAGVFRNLFMSGACEKIAEVSPEAAQGVSEAFSMELNFFGKPISVSIMFWIFIGTIALLGIIFAVIEIIKNKKKVLSK